MLILPLGFSDCWFAPCRISTIAAALHWGLRFLSAGPGRRLAPSVVRLRQNRKELSENRKRCRQRELRLLRPPDRRCCSRVAPRGSKLNPRRRRISPAVPGSRTGSSISTMPAKPATSTTRSPTATRTVGASTGTRARSTIRALPTLPRPTGLHRLRLLRAACSVLWTVRGSLTSFRSAGARPVTKVRSQRMKTASKAWS